MVSNVVAWMDTRENIALKVSHICGGVMVKCFFLLPFQIKRLKVQIPGTNVRLITRNEKLKL